MSEPKKYPSYNGLREYYVVFAYSGPGDIPTWADLEGDPEKYRNRNEWFQHFIFPTTQKEPVIRRISGGIPRTIRFRREAEEVIRSKQYFPPPTYSRTVIEGTEVYFVFSSVENEYLVNYSGSIVTPPNIPGAPIPVDVEKSRNETYKFWEDVEGFNLDAGLMDKYGLLYETDWEGYLPADWHLEVPSYWKKSGGINRGCAAASMANFLGNYSGKQGYLWSGIPYDDTEYKEQYYGLWIMANANTGLYWKMGKYCSDPTGLNDIHIAHRALNDWLGESGKSYKGWSTQHYIKGYNPINDWGFLTQGLGTHCGFVLGEWTPACVHLGHLYVIWGYKVVTEGSTYHWLAGWDPDELIPTAEQFIIEDMLNNGWKFSALKCNNPKHGGGYEPAAVSLSYNVNENDIEFRWTQIRGPEVSAYDIVTPRCLGDYIAFDTIVSLTNDEPGKSDYSVKASGLEPGQKYYLEIKWREGFTTIEEFPGGIR